VLQATATTESEMRTAGFDTIGRGLRNCGYPTLVKAPAGCTVFKTDNLARQCTIDENRLAIQMRDATSIMGQ